MARKPRTRKDMISFLANHQRYDTMSSWNRGTSFSRNIKLQRIQFPDTETHDRAYDLLNVEEAFDDFWEILSDFAVRHNYHYQIRTNGRSGGYLVLYNGGTKDSGYKSFCPFCGQRNYKLVPPWGNEGPSTPQDKVLAFFGKNPHWIPEMYPNQQAIKDIGLPDDEVLAIIRDAKKRGLAGEFSSTDHCGVCKNPRRNFTQPFMLTYTNGETIGEPHGEYDDWDTDSIKNLVDVVWDFDKTAEAAVQAFIDYAKHHEAEEETILVPKKIMVSRAI